MPNVDDHGLEVLKKAARNLDPQTKRDYALQVILKSDESVGGGIYSPSIINHNIANADTEEEITLPINYKFFILKPRKISRLRIAFQANGTNVAWITIPKGGYWIEERRFSSNKIYLQSSSDNNIIEIVSYS